MKLRKIMSLCFMVVMFALVFTGTAFASGTITVAPSFTSGSTLKAGDTIEFSIASTGKLTGLEMSLYYEPSRILHNTLKSTKISGNQKYIYQVVLPRVNGNYSYDLTITDSNNTTFKQTYKVTIAGGQDSKIEITPITPVGKVASGTKVSFKVSSGNSLVFMKDTRIEVSSTNGTISQDKTYVYPNAMYAQTFNMSTELKEPGTYTIKVTAKDAFERTEKDILTYTVDATGTLPDPVTPVPTTDTITIKSSVSNGKTVGPETEVTFTATSNNRTIKKVIVYIDGDKETTETGSKSSLSATIKLPEDDGEYDVKVEAFDDNGKKETKTFTYTIDEDSDEDPKEGVIANDLEDLVIDLWRTSKSRFYELDDEVEFVAYYYNAESKSKKNVVIEVEIPDDFKVTEKNTDNGTASVSKDILKFKLGTLEGKASGEVRFTIKATDDDVTNQITSITAVINSNTDDEEDSSTQLFWMYESGDKGTFNSYIVGYPDGTFRPDNAITREEVAAMFARAFKFNIYSNIKTFSDVSTTRWSYNYIVACAYKNVIKGYTDGTFKPNNNITRAELYTMTFRALGISADEKALYVPKEYKKSDSWERDYVANLVRLSMLEDMDETAPDELATRAEVVYLINRVQFRNPSKTTTSIYSDVFNHWCAKDIESASVTYSYKRSSSGKESIY